MPRKDRPWSKHVSMATISIATKRQQSTVYNGKTVLSEIVSLLIEKWFATWHMLEECTCRSNTSGCNLIYNIYTHQHTLACLMVDWRWGKPFQVACDSLEGRAMIQRCEGREVICVTELCPESWQCSAPTCPSPFSLPLPQLWRLEEWLFPWRDIEWWMS